MAEAMHTARRLMNVNHPVDTGQAAANRENIAVRHGEMAAALYVRGLPTA